MTETLSMYLSVHVRDIMGCKHKIQMNPASGVKKMTLTDNSTVCFSEPTTTPTPTRQDTLKDSKRFGN